MVVSPRSVSLLITSAVACAALAATAAQAAESADAGGMVSNSRVTQGVDATRAATPGASGIGDSYFPGDGNGGYDVAHYTVDVSYEPGTKELTGSTTIRARATQDLSAFNLDFGLRVQHVQVNGQDARFTNAGTEMQVTPSAPLANGAEFTVVVKYADNMRNADRSAFYATKDGGGTVVGQPHSAAWWYPSNDHPLDKATFDINITAPQGWSALSNGVLASKTPSGDRTVWSWKMAQPMATYLAFMSVGKFDITQGTTPAGTPWLNAVASEGISADVRQRAAADVAKTNDIVAWAEGHFGKYPFGAMGAVVPAASMGFALENQSRPVYSTSFWGRGEYESVVVHEIAHQWFGDSVSVKDWQHIWLNEGFASWVQWKWLEDKQGIHANRSFAQAFADAGPSDQMWRLPSGNPGARDMFGAGTYGRGPMVVQALRNRVGDQVFSEIVREWLQRNQHGNGSVAEFMALATQKSGQNLDGFFQAWLFTAARPAETVENGVPSRGLAELRSGAEQERIPVVDAAVFHGHADPHGADADR